MSKVANKANMIFPAVAWQGMSDIHVSICGGGMLGIPFSNKEAIMYLMNSKKVGYAIWGKLQAKFEDFEWLLDGDTFNKLFMVDIGLNLSGKKTSDTPNRVKNPSTGNLFHRIALGHGMIGAVRFWAEPCGYDLDESYVEIGWRFRIVEQKDANEEANVRDEAARRIHEVNVIIEEEYSTLMDMQEPPKEMCKEMDMLVIQLEGH